MSHFTDHDPYSFLDREEPNFELSGREKRVADANDGILKLGGKILSTAAHEYELTGKHSLRPHEGDKIVHKSITHQPPQGLHSANRDL